MPGNPRPTGVTWLLRREPQRKATSQAAHLFRALAAAETVHAMNHLRALQAVKSTAENPKEALAGEIAAFAERYPAMVAAARREGHREAARSFDFARGAEESHARLIQSAVEALEGMAPAELYVCRVCGYVVAGDPPDPRPVCQAGKEFFQKVD